MVLLNGGFVSTSSGCCCGAGCCPNCAPTGLDAKVCFDGSNYWTAQTCCEVEPCPCGGEMVPADENWTACTYHYTCCGSGCAPDGGGFERIDPITCVDTDDHHLCFPCTTIVSAENICKPCPCSEGLLYPPFHNTDDNTYHSSVTNDCCTLTLSYGPEVSKYARFRALTAVNTACGEGYTGSITCSFKISAETCFEVAVSCSGEIDLGGECIENCSGIACDSACIRSSCATGTTNTTTLSNPCDVPMGACCIFGECIIEEGLHCDDDGGFFYGNGTTCPQETCF